ncbi:hypothetical protein pdam_00023289 [Pocillopora damicornis]|uniref:Uncharacterized protein n=1 Tax=Pocillopora damicornis TaxID=46731 RepID=A0A3M6UPN4_POCDA|nr:hypothetical protein pdam_00023289 [Pocillopora damicornis]
MQLQSKVSTGHQARNMALVFELHLDVGKHTVSRLGQYDAIKRDWALKFSSIGTAGIECSSCSLDSSTPLTSPVDTSPHSSLRTGWAVSKPRGSVRFSEKCMEMRNVKNESNARLFTREQWLTVSQVQSFFSRLAAMRRKDQGVIGISLDEEEDIQCVQENSERQDLVDKVNKEIKVSHPICYDT